MTTTSPDPDQPAVETDDKPISKNGTINWQRIIEEHPQLNPPGYDETVERMGYKLPRRQPVGYPRPPLSVQNTSGSVEENITLREKRNNLKGNQGLPYPDAKKIPQKWDRDLGGR